MFVIGGWLARLSAIHQRQSKHTHQLTTVISILLREFYYVGSTIYSIHGTSRASTQSIQWLRHTVYEAEGLAATANHWLILSYCLNAFEVYCLGGVNS